VENRKSFTLPGLEFRPLSRRSYSQLLYRLRYRVYRNMFSSELWHCVVCRLVPKFRRNILPPSSRLRTQYDSMNLNCFDNFGSCVKLEPLVVVCHVTPFIPIAVTDVLEKHAGAQSLCYSRGMNDLFSFPPRKAI
jgi:hypothetical protein